MNKFNKNIKLYILQNKYKYLSEIILNLEKHIDNLYINNLLDFSDKNHILGSLFDLSKNINLSYNNYILENLNTEDDFDRKLLNILKLGDMDEKIVYENLISKMNNFSDYLPLQQNEKEIIDMIYDYGYNNIKDLLKLLKIIPNENQNSIINEINNIFVPVRCQFFSVLNHTEDYYWRVPKKFMETDYLELIRELWIKQDNKYLKIEGYFINDSLSCFIKTSQINYPIFNKIKNKIMCLLNKSSLDIKFIKKFIRYDYLGNIYTMGISQYMNYIEEKYQKYMNYCGLTFINIMKQFINFSSEISKMYEIIFLLLLGNPNNVDIAGLLLNVTKEKKNINKSLIYNLINSKLPYYLLLKIKKSNINIKTEIQRLKNLTTDDIDYKKQLITNNYIPSNIKSLTLEKIDEMKASNNEYYKQLTYVKTILNYPWSSDDDNFLLNISTEPKQYLLNIENKLKNLSYGHEEAKKALLQTIGKWITNPNSKGTSFGFVGPPGVGKTLLAKSVSSALDIPFAEITLGGQNDGEILYGHGYTYSGSQPGLIIKKMVEMGKSRCILYFDELDKTCSKHGSINEITSILIHLTDPNMNKTFQDRFFQGVDFPLDKVIMIFSYNDIKLVDPILLDRLTQIEVNAYTLLDKIKIVKEFIIPEISQSIGFTLDFTDELIEFIIENYTNEAGVRSIKRKIEQIFLTINLNRIYDNSNNIITKETIIKILDKPKNDICLIPKKSDIGIINGLYATSNGDGGIIPIQIFNNFSSNPNSYEIKLTGKQGDVMKESVFCSLTAAIDYIRRTPKYNLLNLDKYLQTNFKYGFHVHAPSTSTPKDGPSAGCAFTAAFISRILNKKIKNDIAMTGEIELTGKITKIGGLNFKLTGAKKAGVKIVYVPKENQDDIEEIKNKYINLISDDFKVILFDYIDEIIEHILC